MGPVVKNQSKMGLTGLHDLYDSCHLYIRRFLFGLSVGPFFLAFTKSDEQVGCRMSDLNKSDVGFKPVRCRIFTSRMSDVGCRILTSRMSNFNKSDVGFLNSDVGWHL